MAELNVCSRLKWLDSMRARLLMALRLSATSWVNKWYFPSHRKSNIRNYRFHSWGVVIRSMSPSGAVDRKMWLNIAKQTWMHRLKCTANEWEAPSFCECLLRYKIPKTHCFNDQSCVAELANITRSTATWTQDLDIESSSYILIRIKSIDIPENYIFITMRMKSIRLWMQFIVNVCYSEWKI